MNYKREDGSVATYTAQEEQLIRRALKRGTTGHGLDMQVRAVQKMKDLKMTAPVPLDAILAELEYAASDPLCTYLGSQVARRAEELHAWLTGEADVEEWPSPTPDQIVGAAFGGPGDDYWPFRPGDPLHGDVFADLAYTFDFGEHNGGVRYVTHADRDRDREAYEGHGPPWIRGKVTDHYNEPGDV